MYTWRLLSHQKEAVCDNTERPALRACCPLQSVLRRQILCFITDL